MVGRGGVDEAYIYLDGGGGGEETYLGEGRGRRWRPKSGCGGRGGNIYLGVGRGKETHLGVEREWEGDACIWVWGGEEEETTVCVHTLIWEKGGDGDTVPNLYWGLRVSTDVTNAKFYSLTFSETGSLNCP